MKLRPRLLRSAVLFRRHRSVLLPALSVAMILALYQNCGRQISHPGEDESLMTDPALQGATATDAPLVIEPSSVSIGVASKVMFKVKGGAGSVYSFSVVSGPGTVNKIGQYTAPPKVGLRGATAVVEVVDSSGVAVQANVNISPIADVRDGAPIEAGHATAPTAAFPTTEETPVPKPGTLPTPFIVNTPVQGSPSAPLQTSGQDSK